MDIGVIGAGASGIVAALSAKKNGGNVTILEHMPRIGNKILITGSGRCNITNEDMDISHYHSEDLNVAKSVLKECPKEMTLSFLADLGLYYKNKNGYYYPYSEQASTVLDILRFAIRDENIKVISEIDIITIEKNKNKFIVKSSNSKELVFDKIILCTGSKCYKKTGSDGSGYDLAKNFGHSIVQVKPALTYLMCSEDFYPSIAGIRTHSNISIFIDNDKVSEETGELQITKTGISGIPVFNQSYLVSKALANKKRVHAIIDFLPELKNDELRSMIDTKISSFPNRSAEELFVGILHKNIGLCILKRLGLKANVQLNLLSEANIDDIVESLKSFKTIIKSTGEFENSQVCSGGVDFREVNNNLESKLIKGLFFAGEILDINGDCGGYNLQWAFSSGLVAGRSCLK